MWGQLGQPQDVALDVVKPLHQAVLLAAKVNHQIHRLFVQLVGQMPALLRILKPPNPVFDRLVLKQVVIGEHKHPLLLLEPRAERIGRGLPGRPVGMPKQSQDFLLSCLLNLVHPRRCSRNT